MLPPAPARFSTTKGCFSTLCRRSFTRRVRISEGPPGGKVISVRTGLAGQVCAAAPKAVHHAATARIRRIMRLPGGNAEASTGKPQIAIAERLTRHLLSLVLGYRVLQVRVLAAGEEAQLVQGA